MVLLGLNVNGHTINVRTDDLSTEERERVHACADLLPKFEMWKKGAVFNGIVVVAATVVIAMIGFMVLGAFGYVHGNSLEDKVMLFGISSPIVITIGMIPWIVASVTAKRSSRGGRSILIEHMQASSRCDSFVREYAHHCKYVRDQLNTRAEPAKATA